jgi:hypothetical protein
MGDLNSMPWRNRFSLSISKSWNEQKSYERSATQNDSPLRMIHDRKDQFKKIKGPVSASDGMSVYSYGVDRKNPTIKIGNRMCLHWVQKAASGSHTRNI